HRGGGPRGDRKFKPRGAGQGTPQGEERKSRPPRHTSGNGQAAASSSASGGNSRRPPRKGGRPDSRNRRYDKNTKSGSSRGPKASAGVVAGKSPSVGAKVKGFFKKILGS